MTRRLGALLLGASIAACSSNRAFVPPPAAQPAFSAAAADAAAHATVTIAIPKSGQRAPGSRYVSPATRSIAIAMKPAQGKALQFAADLRRGEKYCTSSAKQLTCAVTMSLASGAYTATLSTYDGLLQGGKPTGKVLSVDRDLAVKIAAKGANAIKIALAGAPESIAFIPATGSALTGSGASFTFPKCGSTAQLGVYGVDAAAISSWGPELRR
ncbi:MAG TPA: hypothetical protein VMH02_10605 [Verrucomicrobiae bacterium]|nr:hypothetical protein [Verrucomicrobiae bacterium]